MKKQGRLDVRKYSFSQSAINVWNNLSTDCVHASSVNMFKNKIDMYLEKVYSENILYSEFASSCDLHLHGGKKRARTDFFK